MLKMLFLPFSWDGNVQVDLWLPPARGEYLVISAVALSHPKKIQPEKQTIKCRRGKMARKLEN